VNIAAADAAGFDLDKHILRAGFRLGHIAHLEVSQIFEYKSLHESKDNSSGAEGLHAIAGQPEGSPEMAEGGAM
jgi:hypothetical protein